MASKTNPKFVPSYQKYSAIRDEKGLTDSKVANDIDITASSLSDWKNSGALINVDKVYRIAKYLGVTVEDIMEERQVND